MRSGLFTFLLVPAMLCGGCGMLGSDEGSTAVPATGDRCAELLTDPTVASKPSSINVLLADGSASGFTRTGTIQRHDWATELAKTLPQNGMDLVSVGLFGGSIDWKIDKITAGKSNDAARTKIDQDDIRTCLTGDLTDAMRSAPTKAATDVLRALAEGADKVRSRPGAKSIYLATDGLSNTGCADLRAADIGDETAIPKLVDACKPELPTLDKTFTVQFIGIGNATQGQPDIKTPQRTWMRSLWKALCDATGATCKDPDTAAPKSVAAQALPLPDDPEVAMPAIKVKQGNPMVITMPASILFNVDSYALASGRSQDTLEQVYAKLRQTPHREIKVAGHTDSTGTPDHNRTLSKQRAEAVKAALVGQGFANIEANGFASTQPECSPEYKDGRADPIAMACNRRVEIFVYI